MEIEIRNFRGIAQGVLPLDTHVFIAGPNGSGKTSISMALSAAFSGHAAPWADVKAKDAKCLLRDGTKRGCVSLKAGEQTVNINYPGGSVSGEVDAKASDVALGLVSVADMKPADAATLLAKYMGAEPAFEDLAEAIGEQVAQQVWPVIEANGWDAALTRAKESGSRLKGQWEGVTGENYGSAKAQNWRPEGAEAYNLTGDLEAAVKAAREQHQALLSNQAVGNDRIERLQATIDSGKVAENWLQAAQLDVNMTTQQCQDELQSLRQQAKQASEQAHIAAQLDDWKALVDNLPGLLDARNSKAEIIENDRKTIAELKHRANTLPKPADKAVTAACPSCGTHVVVVTRQSLALPEGQLSDEENAARQQAIEQAVQAVTAAENQLEKHERDLTEIQTRIRVAEEAKQKIEQAHTAGEPVNLDAVLQQINVLSEAVSHLNARDHGRAAAEELASLNAQQGAAPEEIAAAEQALHDAEAALSIRQSIDHAAKLAGQIAKNANIVAALMPTGVRQTVLARALENFNAMLAAVCKTAHWEPVAVTEAMQITYEGRGYGWQLSESEKFRTRVALQFVMASIDQSALVVVDAADILDSKGRNGLLALIKGAERPVIMTMTMNQKADVPNLKGLGVSSFWINQSGEIEPV